MLNFRSHYLLNEMGVKINPATYKTKFKGKLQPGDRVKMHTVYGNSKKIKEYRGKEAVVLGKAGSNYHIRFDDGEEFAVSSMTVDLAEKKKVEISAKIPSRYGYKVGDTICATGYPTFMKVVGFKAEGMGGRSKVIVEFEYEGQTYKDEHGANDAHKVIDIPHEFEELGFTKGTRVYRQSWQGTHTEKGEVVGAVIMKSSSGRKEPWLAIRWDRSGRRDSAADGIYLSSMYDLRKVKFADIDQNPDAFGDLL